MCMCLTSSDTLLSMAPNMECRAPAENPELSSLRLTSFGFSHSGNTGSLATQADNHIHFSAVSPHSI